MTTIDEEFSRLSTRAMQAYDEELANVSFESALLDILNFVKNNLSHRDRFVELFEQLLHSKLPHVKLFLFV